MEAHHWATTTRSAPRYDPRLFDAIRRLDDEEQPFAETCRRVAAVAEELGLCRPSTVHLRTFVKEQRRRRRELRELQRRLAADVLDVFLDPRGPARQVARLQRNLR